LKWDLKHASVQKMNDALDYLADGDGPNVVTVDFSDAQSAPSYTARLRQLSEYKPKKVIWEWEPYIPKGMITMMTGDPGSLKSYLALAICAYVTNGISLTSGHGMQAGTCLYLTNENDPEYVIRPRFDGLGGNAKNFFLVEDTRRNGDAHQLTLADIDILRDLLKDIPHCRVLVIDPIQSYLGSGVDAWRSNQTRPLLDQLAKLTREHNVATIVIRHARKSGSSRAIHRGLDSIDFTGAARSELLIGSTADAKQRAMIHIKSNVGPIGAPIEFKIEPGGLAGQFKILGESTLTAADLSAPEKGEDSALSDAQEFLKEMLVEGALPFTEIEQQRKVHGIASKTLQRAKAALGIKSRQYHGKDGKRWWEWQMDESDSHQ
jgi:hypothetical protein